MKSISIVCVVAAVAFITYQLGLLESPPFIYHSSFLGGRELYAIMATTRQRGIGKHVERLMVASKNAVASLEGNQKMRKAASKVYDVDDKTSAIGVGLYFDDRFAYPDPRWAVGWVVEGPTFEELQALLPQLQEASGLSLMDNPIRVVRIGGKGTEIITARFPWRNYFTPMIAPMLNWGGGFQTYEDYIKKHKEADNGVPPISLEVYVHEGSDYAFIDCTVLFGSIEHTWEDSFPGTMLERESEGASRTE